MYQVSLAPTTAIPAASAFLDCNGGGAVRDDVADVVAAIEPRGDGCLVKYADRTAAIAGTFHTLGDTDGSGESAVMEAAQLAIDQVVRD